MDNQNQTPAAPGSQPEPPKTPPANPLPNSPLNPAGPNPAGNNPTSGRPAGGGISGPTAAASRPAANVPPELYSLNRPAPAPEEPPTPSALSQVSSAFWGIMGGIFSWVIFPVAVVLILHNFVFQAYHVLGTSMVPTLHDTDYLIVSKLGYTQALVERMFGQDKKYIPARGQIVVFRYPRDPSKVFVKRVIGLPGDRVVIKNGSVTVYNKANPNGFNPNTGYEPADAITLIDTDETVQNGNIFVLGDNRSAGGSYDSREWGELPSSYIIGNAVLRLLPLDQIKVL